MQKIKLFFSGGVGIGYHFKPKFDIPIRTELMFTMRGNLNKDTNAQHVSYEDADVPKMMVTVYI